MKTDVDIWIEEFFETGRDALQFIIKDNMSPTKDERQDIIYGLKAHFEAGYCWHFAHMLKTVFERGEVRCVGLRHSLIFVSSIVMVKLMMEEEDI